MIVVLFRKTCGASDLLVYSLLVVNCFLISCWTCEPLVLGLCSAYVIVMGLEIHVFPKRRNEGWEQEL